MAEIVGTITNLSDFLSKTQVCLSVKPNDPQQQIICLEADRKYSIPAFQREVRWDDNNLKNLCNHILAEDTDMDARDYQLLRGRSVREVQSTNGQISFKEALDFQKTV